MVQLTIATTDSHASLTAEIAAQARIQVIHGDKSDAVAYEGGTVCYDGPVVVGTVVDVPVGDYIVVYSELPVGWTINPTYNQNTPAKVVAAQAGIAGVHLSNSGVSSTDPMASTQIKASLWPANDVVRLREGFGLDPDPCGPLMVDGVAVGGVTMTCARASFSDLGYEVLATAVTETDGTFVFDIPIADWGAFPAPLEITADLTGLTPPGYTATRSYGVYNGWIDNSDKAEYANHWQSWNYTLVPPPTPPGRLPFASQAVRTWIPVDDATGAAPNRWFAVNMDWDEVEAVWDLHDWSPPVDQYWYLELEHEGIFKTVHGSAASMEQFSGTSHILPSDIPHGDAVLLYDCYTEGPYVKVDDVWTQVWARDGITEVPADFTTMVPGLGPVYDAQLSLVDTPNSSVEQVVGRQPHVRGQANRGGGPKKMQAPVDLDAGTYDIVVRQPADQTPRVYPVLPPGARFV